MIQHCVRSLLCISVFFTVLTGSLMAQSEDSVILKIYSVQELKADFNYWRNRLESKHPLLYYYESKAIIDSAFNSLEAQIDHPMDEFEFFNLIAPMVELIKDGHNSVLPSHEGVEAIIKNQNLLPLVVGFHDDYLYVRRDYSLKNELEIGATITHINGIPHDSLIQSLMRVLPRDGYNLQYARTELNDIFRFYFHVVHGFNEEYVIGTSGPFGDSEFTVKALDLNTIRERRKKLYGKSLLANEGKIDLEISDSLQTAFLTIPTWDRKTIKKEFRQNFKKVIRTYMKEIRERDVDHLVIDVRGNGGGNPTYVRYLLQYLFDEPFLQSMECRVVSRKHEEDFEKRTRRKWYPWYGIGKFRNRKKHFDGSLYVLMDQGSFSASACFVAILDNYNKGRLLGSTTAGNPHIHSGYLNKTSVKLPNTKMRVAPGNLCNRYKEISEREGYGLDPNIEVIYSRQDIIDGRDRTMETVLNMINFKPRTQ